MRSTRQPEDANAVWQLTHEALEAHATKRAGLDFEEGGLLLAARRAEVHRHFGYGSFVEYVERLLGYAPRVTHDKLRVAEALEAMPALARELQEGSLEYSQVRELTRVATPETEEIWVSHARGRTTRDVEKLVSGRRPARRWRAFERLWRSCRATRASTWTTTRSAMPSTYLVPTWASLSRSPPLEQNKTCHPR